MLNFEGDYEGAERHYRAALDERPDHLQTLSNLAGILAFRGELDEAASLSRRALALDPKAFSPNFQMGRILLQQKKFLESVPYLRAAVEARSDSGQAHLQLGIALGMAILAVFAVFEKRRNDVLGVLERIKQILAAAGTSLDNVMTATTYLTRVQDVPAYNEEYAKYFPTNKPARTTVTVAALNSPDLVVEITVTACIPG